MQIRGGTEQVDVQLSRLDNYELLSSNHKNWKTEVVSFICAGSEDFREVVWASKGKQIWENGMGEIEGL